jgi:hypothetical protein
MYVFSSNNKQLQKYIPIDDLQFSLILGQARCLSEEHLLNYSTNIGVAAIRVIASPVTRQIRHSSRTEAPMRR